jgi:3D (Asp-Asp-Asp) domain-containing protein
VPILRTWSGGKPTQGENKMTKCSANKKLVSVGTEVVVYGYGYGIVTAIGGSVATVKMDYGTEMDIASVRVYPAA